MPLTNYLTLGRSGLRVSPFCLGTMTFGEDWGWGSPVAESEAILARYLELGGNFLDTANGYTKGHSEVIIGDYFARAGRRDRVVIATKFGTNLYLGDPNGGGAGRKTIIESCEQSLRRLKTDYIDLYWMHFWDPHTPIDETMRALDDLVRAGKVRYLGVSDTPAWKVTQGQLLAQFHGGSPFVGLQIEYSLIERTVEGELVPMARELGLGITPWSPLRGGVLSGKYTRANAAQANPDRGDRVKAFLTERNLAIIDEADPHRRRARRLAGQRGAGVGAVAAGRDVHHHRRAAAGSTRAEPRRARPDAARQRHRGAQRGVGAVAEFPGAVLPHDPAVRAGWHDGQRHAVDRVAVDAEDGCRALLQARS